MPQHTITVTIDVPAGLESAVAQLTHQAIVALNDYARGEINAIHHARRLIHNASPLKARPAAIQEILDSLKAQADRTHQATDIVGLVWSEIDHALNVADMEWRRSQATPGNAPADER